MEEKKKNPKRVTAGKKSAEVRKENAEKLKKELREMKEKLHNSPAQKSLDNVEDSSEISQKNSDNSQQHFNIKNVVILGIIGIGLSAAVFYKYCSTNSKKYSTNAKKILNNSEQSPQITQQCLEKKPLEKIHLKINNDPFYME